MIPAARVTVRLGSAQLAKLDAMAEATGISRSLVLRRLLDDVEAAAPTELSRDDLVRLLEERARAGSAPATRELPKLPLRAGAVSSPRARAVSASTAAQVWVFLWVSVPTTIMSTVPSN